MDKTMKLWQVALTNILTGAILCFITYAFTRAGNRVDENDKVIKELAKVSYVDNRDKELKSEIDNKVDKDTFNELKKSIDDMKSDVRDIRNYILQHK